MGKVTFLGVDGSHSVVEVPPGSSVMRAAVDNGVPGIIGECGGRMVCGTCHVYVDRTDGQFAPPGPVEDEMLEYTAAPRLPESRLGCQLVPGADVTEIVVRVPDRQTL